MMRQASSQMSRQYDLVQNAAQSLQRPGLGDERRLSLWVTDGRRDQSSTFEQGLSIVGTVGGTDSASEQSGPFATPRQGVRCRIVFFLPLARHVCAWIKRVRPGHLFQPICVWVFERRKQTTRERYGGGKGCEEEGRDKGAIRGQKRCECDVRRMQRS